ncbi:T9SS type A sorting domain-containing protein [Aurantibacillus circumpalustris]|uniref:T9SS type A sorting domain-containing protein n=1 Tax=Aurantibacillus circumpalustris TaxID=3036359 RepID=UPI00295ADA39|nr:DUF4465 domain-containing protein [Aurantibacillus circumpalustris]
MKKTITIISLALTGVGFNAQTVADFENLTLGTDTFYENHNGDSWVVTNATFRYAWDTTYNLWDAGFAYTNKNNITDGTYNNLYGAITGKGYNNSNKYVTASQGYFGGQMRVKLSASEKSVLGFFVTNSTYGYKTMLNGGGPARAFGDTLHTHSGLQPGNYPDWFKLTVYAYKNGTKKTDTVEFYLADYRFSNNSQDYIVNAWTWVDCSTLGNVDSVSFKLYSSDIGIYGINNPTYFCLDNFSTSSSIVTGLTEGSSDNGLQVYPNPFNSMITVQGQSPLARITIKDMAGKIVHDETMQNTSSQINLNDLQSGIYLLQMRSETNSTVKKIIKN